MRVLAVDPGEARIGIALSDPLGVVARPLTIIDHISRAEDARQIIALALQNNAHTILVGVPLDQAGEVGPQARKSLRLIEEIQLNSEIEVVPWDESGSTEKARAIQSSSDSLDAIAAAVILQDFLDVQSG